MQRSSIAIRATSPSVYALVSVLILAVSLSRITQADAAQGTTLDPRFGRHGEVSLQPLPGLTSSATSIAVARNGDLVVGASATTIAGAPASSGAGFLVRLLRDGSVDRSFGRRGVVAPPGLSGVTEVVTAAGGQILALGGSLVRVRQDGTLDRRFGSRGVAVLPPSFNAMRFVIEPRSSIVLLGTMTLDGGASAVSVARLTRTGQPDLSFGVHGIAQLAQSADPSGDPLSSAAPRGLALQGHGAIIATLQAETTNHGIKFPASLAERVAMDGRLDTTFGSGGEVVIGGLGETVGAFDPLITRKGTIVIPIMAAGGTGLIQAPYVYSISSDGHTTSPKPELIPEFEPIGPLLATPYGGYVLVSGFRNLSVRGLSVSYYGANLETWIGLPELALTLPPGASDPSSLIAVQPDSKLVLAGSATASNGREAMFVARVLQAIVGVARQRISRPQGDVGLRLTCSRAVACEGTATLSTALDGREIVLGSSTFSVPSGSSANAVIRLNPNGYKLLVKSRAIRATLTLAPASGPVRIAKIVLPGGE